MKKVLIFVLTFAALLLANAVYSQNQPFSFKNSELLSEIDNVVVAAPDMVQIMNEDASDEKNGEMYKVARILDVNMNIDNCIRRCFGIKGFVPGILYSEWRRVVSV